MFDELAREMDGEHAAEATKALRGLANARDDREAWRHWRALERGWERLSRRDRADIKAAARRLLQGAVDGERRLSVVERLDG